MGTNEKTIRLNPLHAVGLTEHEVLQRQKEGLTNIVDNKISKSNWEIIRTNLFTLFNAFNLVIAICLALVGAYSNMTYLIIILINISTGIIQEIHAKKMVENLSLLSAAKVSVVRNGVSIEIPIEELVLDDIMILDLGKQICADSIVEHGEVEVNEALLTGEVDPIVKKAGDALLSGSYIVSGKCWAKVEHVGEENFAVKLSLEAKKNKQSTSKLMLSMRRVTKITSFFIIPIGVLLFIEAYFFRLQPINASVIATSAALLGMLPKGLVLLISISLVTGIIRLSRKKILVQELYCIENLAHVDVLCLDKTGTITEGKITVSDVYKINENEMPVSIDTAIGLFIGAMEDNNATFMALKEYIDPNYTHKPLEKTSFSSERKWSSVTFEGLGTIILGAPEKLVHDDMSKLPLEVLEAQEDGKRILCLGFSNEPVAEGILPDIKLVAAIGFKDPIRKNVKETLDFFKQEGVEIKVISGDNPITVSNIAKQAGLAKYNSYIDMSQITTEGEIEEAAKQYTIFGRVTPNQKSGLVKALKKHGHTVAMTGDGVNDVLALKEADCSIAMAAGSDAAKQISQLVLLDSDFSVLPDVVMAGRQVVNNITRVGGIFLIKTIYSVLLSIFCVLTFKEFPFVPIQITLIDLAIEGYPSFFMQFETNHERIKEDFLGAVFKRALPYAVMIIISIIATTFLSSMFEISQNHSVTVMYYATSFISILAVIRACRPFNTFRFLLCSTMTIGFYFATILFANIIHLEIPTINGFIFFIGLAVISIPITKLIRACLASRF